MGLKAYTTDSRLSETQKYLHELYPNKDVSIDYLYGYLARTGAYLVKNINLNTVKTDHFIKHISWIFALSSKLQIRTEDAIAKRFPGTCPYCLATECKCVRTKKNPVSYIPAYKVQEELNWRYNSYIAEGRLLTLDATIKNINNIYDHNEIVWFIEKNHHLIKIQEEIGEIHEAYSKFLNDEKPKTAVEEEIADTLAWVLSAWAFCFPEISLDDSFIDYYQFDCPICRNFSCSCSQRQNRAAELVDINKLSEIDGELSKLIELLPDNRKQIMELKKSINSAIETQSDPIVRTAVNQTKTELETIKDKLSTVDDISKKSNSIVTSIASILGKISMLN